MNNVQTFESEVRPLVKQLQDLCTAKGIPFVAAFQVGQDEKQDHLNLSALVRPGDSPYLWDVVEYLEKEECATCP